jgi:hypothetical protein
MKKAAQVGGTKSTHGKLSVVILIFAALFLLLAQSSFWVKNTIFDKKTFTTIALTTIQEEENRNAIASTVVDTALADRPVLMRVAGDRATSLLSGLLVSDLGTNALNRVINSLYSYMLKADRQDIAINLESVKTPLVTLTTLAENSGRPIDFEPENIPDSIVLLEKDALPNLSTTYRAVIWLSPLLWLTAISLFATYVYLGAKEYAKRVYIAYGAIVVVALVGLSTGPFLPPSIAAMVQDTNAQVLAASFTTAFLEPFMAQMWQMLAIATVAVAIFWQRHRIASATQNLLLKMKAEPKK